MASAQNGAGFRHFNKKDGLSHSSVFAIAQDGDGFIWLGTRDGLNKYDGAKFKVYRKGADRKSEIISNDIRILYYDAHTEYLWAGSFDGLSQYSPITDQFTNFTTSPDQGGLSSNVVRAIFRDTKQQLWVGTKDGLNLQQSDGSFQQVLPDSYRATLRSISAVYEDTQGRLIVGTSEGLYELRQDEKANYSLQLLFDESQFPAFAKYAIRSVLEDAEGNIYVGTQEEGLYRWNKSTQTVSRFRHDSDDLSTLSNDHIRYMQLAPDGSLWVGTFLGLNKQLAGQDNFQRFLKDDRIPASLSNSSIRAVLFDQRGGMWVGTYHGGLNYFDAVLNQFTNFRQLPNQNSISHNVVSSFAEDEKGNIWIGTEGGGLNYFDRDRQQFTSYKSNPGQANSLSGNNVKTLLLDEEQLWIGTYQQGLNMLDLKTGKFEHFTHDPNAEDGNSIAGNNVYAIMKDSGQFWLLCHNTGLSIYDPNERKFYNFLPDPNEPESFSSDLPRAILKDKKGRIWIGTSNGLKQAIRNSAGSVQISFRHHLPALNIYTIYEDHKGLLWLGTFGSGLIQFDPDNLQQQQHYREADGLSGNTVLGILEDHKGMLWLSTNNGITRLDPTTNTLLNYNNSNGLINHEYNYNAYYKTRSGELLFGGIEGFSLFHPKDIQSNNYVPPIAFTGLKQYNSVVQPGDDNNILTNALNHTDHLVFRHNEANFTLGFAVLDYINAGNNQYAYQLEGIDPDWNYNTGESEATYTIQRHGNYKFRLKGSNSDGVWSAKERVLTIEVLPPPWLTGWAYLLYAVVLALLVIAVVRYVRLRHRLQLEQLAKQQQKELNE
ncbi:MAG: two-component regulator propeller domain-containing protein, partial [Bacteroidota bacterium]